jgi:crossover junction endodeoxyribonuclease RuvC
MAKRILGVDPGSRNTGFAIIAENNGRLEVLDCDVFKTHKIENHTDRLQAIFNELSAIIKKYKPTHCAVETPIYGVDPLAMLKLGRAQAAALLAITNEGVPVEEYYPKVVKKAITGNGNASKDQVAYMLGKVLVLPDKKLSGDATDALAVAWCHYTHLGSVGGSVPKKKLHQNNKKSDWSSFVADNPERVKGHGS